MILHGVPTKKKTGSLALDLKASPKGTRGLQEPAVCTKKLRLHKDSGTQSTLLQEIGVQHSWPGNLRGNHMIFTFLFVM